MLWTRAWQLTTLGRSTQGNLVREQDDNLKIALKQGIPAQEQNFSVTDLDVPL
jgi:hypothetical protein